ncbi:MAG: hypothetical protein J6U14_03000 [Bacteroidaceae bacterium]|nr:hypothetical protein [Bacteroidaceae bacterium]
MKRLVYIWLVLVVCVACSPFRTFRINRIIGNEVQRSLSYPYSYDPVSIHVDSAFAPYDLPELYNLLVEDMGLNISIEAYNTNIRTHMMTMSAAEKNYTPEARRLYEEARNELRRNIALKREAIEKQDVVREVIERLKEMPKRFIGFKANHKYHAMDNELRLLLLNELFILSPELDAILGRYDLNDEYDKDVRALIEEAKEEERRIETEEV